MKITPALAQSVRPASTAAVAVEALPEQRDKFQKGFLQKAGDRLKFAGQEGLFCAGLAVAGYAIPFATTAAISRLVPPWVPFGGMVANLVLGAGLSAALAGVAHDKFAGEPTTDRERKSETDAMLAAACFGGIGGFMGTAACPGAVVDWAGVGVLSAGIMGTGAVVLGVPNFLISLVKGPVA